MSDKHQLVSIGIVALRTGAPRAWLRAEAEAGRIPHLKAGQRLLFYLETVERILLERARQPEGAST